MGQAENRSNVTKSGIIAILAISIILITATFYVLYKLEAFSSKSELFAMLIASVVFISVFVLIGVKTKRPDRGSLPEPPDIMNKNTAYPWLIPIMYVGGTILLGAIILYEGITGKDRYQIAGGITSFVVAIVLLWAFVMARRIK